MSGSRVIHSDDLPWETGGHGDLFAHRRRRLAKEAGGQQLGCSLMELDPGKTAWPFHYHQANEEALYILAGEAMLRLGSERVRVRAGDYVALPTGPDHAHQLTNTGAEVVRYLVLSTLVTPDVCVYPDSDKVGVVGALTDADGQPQRVVTFQRSAEVGYWEGETTTLDGEEPSAEASSSSKEQREAKLDQMVDDDLAALKRKLGDEDSGAEASSTAKATSEAKTSDETPDAKSDTKSDANSDETSDETSSEDQRDATIDQMVDDDLADLKRKLKMESMVESDLDDLKRKLED